MIRSKMTKTFRQALLDALDKTATPLLQVAEGSGVSYPQLQKVKKRPKAKTNVEDGLKVARFFGLTVNEFMADTLAEDRLEQVRLWQELTAEERALIRELGRARAAEGRAEG